MNNNRRQIIFTFAPALLLIGGVLGLACSDKDKKDSAAYQAYLAALASATATGSGTGTFTNTVVVTTTSTVTPTTTTGVTTAVTTVN